MNIMFAQNLEWAIKINSNVISGSSISVSNGNVYLYGMFNDSIDFYIPGFRFYNLNNDNFYLAKFNNSGQLKWVSIIKTFDKKKHNLDGQMTIDSKGNAYICGYFSDSLLFDQSGKQKLLISKGGTDIFIAKFDSSGNFLWANQIGGTGSEYISRLVTDKNDNLIIAGTISDSKIYLNSTPLNTDQDKSNILLAKFLNDGNLIWIKCLKSNYWVLINDLNLDNNSNIYIAGSFFGKTDFDPSNLKFEYTSIPFNKRDIFFAKYDSNGNFIWAKSIGSKSDDYVSGIKADNAGGFYLTGAITDTIDLDPGPGQVIYNKPINYNWWRFIARYSDDGNFKWVKVFTDSSNTSDMSIELDQQNNIYCYGNFYKKISLDFEKKEHLLYGDDVDIFIGRYNQNLDFNWGFKLSSKSMDGASSICVDDHFNVFISGAFDDSIDFDPGQGKYILSKGRIFLAKYSPCTKSYDSAFICQGDTLKFANQKLTTAGDYKGLFPTYWGCDSLVYLNLKINPTYIERKNAKICLGNDFQFPNGKISKSPLIDTSYLKTYKGCDSVVITNLRVVEPDTSVSLIGITFTAKDSLCEHYWYNCNENALIAGENDNVYKAKTNGSYALIVSKENCLDTSSCYNISFEVFHFIPNSFTPNNDGLNDLFKPEGIGILNYQITIFNQWGEQIFKGNKNTPWNGYFKDKPVETGVYYYIIKFETIFEKHLTKTGTVNVIR